MAFFVGRAFRPSRFNGSFAWVVFFGIVHVGNLLVAFDVLSSSSVLRLISSPRSGRSLQECRRPPPDLMQKRLTAVGWSVGGGGGETASARRAFSLEVVDLVAS